MGTNLHHITLNTGHIAKTSRSDVHPHIIDFLLPILDAEGGPVPGLPGWHLSLLFPLDDRGAPRPGAAFFQIADERGTSERPAVVAMACWSDTMQAKAWEHTIASYRAWELALQACEFWHDPPTNPPPLPWLAICLTPWINAASMSAVQALGDLERCIAWGLIER
jgi:hypothetical protein